MSDLDPDEAMATEAGAALWREDVRSAGERRHKEHMAVLDRIAAALERLADGRP